MEIQGKVVRIFPIEQGEPVRQEGTCNSQSRPTPGDGQHVSNRRASKMPSKRGSSRME